MAILLNCPFAPVPICPLCLLEPTVVSVGRGTATPFEWLGHPSLDFGDTTFTPVPVPGAAPHPKHEGKPCTGQHLGALAEGWRAASSDKAAHQTPGFSLTPLQDWTDAWRDAHGSLEGFFTSPSFFDKLAGTDVLRRALEAGYDLSDLERMWRADHRTFFEAAQPHLLYSWNAPLPGR